MALATGDQIGPYEVLSRLGAGGMGEVFLARDSRLDRLVAIKGLPRHLVSDPTARERLRREAIAAASLDHPFVCKVFELLDHGEAAYIVLEYVEGQTLHDKLTLGALALPDGLRMAGEIAEALEAAHARALVHRDLKPSNVMLTRQGRVKIMDFGLARYACGEAAETVAAIGPRAPLTEEGTRVGTPDYMSPEQALGEQVDARSDLFSFGILLCEVLTGLHPFRRSHSGSTLAAIVREEPTFGPGSGGLPPAIVVMLRRMLAKAPRDRYASVGEFRHDLESLSGLSASVAAPAAMGRGSTRYPLAGRTAEYAELVGGLDAAVAGHGTLALISGEPGIGKTRLTAEVLAEAKARGFFCLAGHSYEMEGAPPYVPFIEMLEYSARSVPPSAFRNALGDAASAVSKLMPELRRMFPDIPQPPNLPPEQQRRYLFNAYLEFVERSCRTTPIAVVLEDLHWADEPTLMLLEHVVQGATSLPLFIMVTYRDVELGVTRPFARTLERLLRERRGTRVVLRRLSGDAVAAMLTSLSGHPPPLSLARVIYAETEGNPFFVEEVFQHLVEEKQLFNDTGGWRTDLQVRTLVVPESVRLVIGRRMERLGEATRRVLTTAALVGRTFGLRVIESLDVAPDAVLDAIEEAEAAHLVVAEPAGREPRYRFAHELIRQTLIESVSLPRRQRQHARIAAALEQVYSGALDRHASTLAHHLYQAGTAADRLKTTEWLRKASSQARLASGFEEALAALDDALSLWEGESNETVAGLHAERGAVLRALGRAANAIASYRSAVVAYEADGKPETAAATAADLSAALMWAGQPHQAYEVSKRALSQVAGRVPALECRLMFHQVLQIFAEGRADEGVELLDRATALQKTIADPTLEAEAMGMATHAAWVLMQLERTRENARRLADRMESTGNEFFFAEVKWMEAGALLHLGDPQAVLQMCADLQPRAARAGHQDVAWICRSFGALIQHLTGDLETARKTYEDARRFARANNVSWGFIDTQGLAVLAMCQGDRALADRLFAETISEQPHTYWDGMTEAYCFLHEALDGNLAAVERLPRLPAPPHPGQPALAGAWYSTAPRVQGLAALGRHDDVVALLPATEALLGIGSAGHFWGAKTARGIALAAAHRWTEAEQQHQSAIEQADRLSFGFLRPQARDWYARTLHSRNQPGDAARARALLGEAVQMYEQIGMRAFAARAAAQLASYRA